MSGCILQYKKALLITSHVLARSEYCSTPTFPFSAYREMMDNATAVVPLDAEPRRAVQTTAVDILLFVPLAR